VPGPRRSRCRGHGGGVYSGSVELGVSVRFFDQQFRSQVQENDFSLNPFEQVALPYLRGRVLDYGCGLGNLAVEASRCGCEVLALDASPTAVARIRRVAAVESLPLEAAEADLRSHEIREDFDTVVAIGLLMFFDRPTALKQLQALQVHVRPGGVAVINVLVEGTTYLDMFDPDAYCLFARDELRERFAAWEVLHAEHRDFPAPRGLVKAFDTLIAAKPGSRLKSEVPATVSA